jgi:transposase
VNREGFPNRLFSDSRLGLDRKPAWMAKPYSLDLRDRAVARVAAGETVRSVAATLRVGVSSVVNRRSWLQKWSQRFRATGSAAPGKMGATDRAF